MTQSRHGQTSVLTDLALVRTLQTADATRYVKSRLTYGSGMRRRDFIGLAAALTAMPHTAAAQAGRTRVVGVLLSQTEGSDEAKDRVAAIRDGLQKLGWTEGRNLRLDVRYGEGNAARMGVLAAELTRSEIDVLFASATTALSWLQKTTSTVPIVFAPGHRSGRRRLRAKSGTA